MDSPKSPHSPPENNHLPPRKRYKSSTPEDDHIDDTGTTASSTPPKSHQFAIPKDVTEGSASRTITAWKKLHEINLLESILEYHKQKGAYPFDDETHMQRFYKDWLETGVYIDEDVFSSKMVELPERFFKNQDKTFIMGTNLKAWMPPIDVKIYELSNIIWGNNDDDDDGGGDAVGGSCIDPTD